MIWIGFQNLHAAVGIQHYTLNIKANIYLYITEKDQMRKITSTKLGTGIPWTTLSSESCMFKG